MRDRDTRFCYARLTPCATVAANAILIADASGEVMREKFVPRRLRRYSFAAADILRHAARQYFFS